MYNKKFAVVLGNVLDPLSLNRYNYGKSNPVKYTDPSGHYTMMQGTDAHQTLGAHLKAVYPEDILYKGAAGDEIYELKIIEALLNNYFPFFFILPPEELRPTLYLSDDEDE